MQRLSEETGRSKRKRVKRVVDARVVSAFALSFLPYAVIETLRVDVGAAEETAGVAGAREHPRHVGAESGAGGQRDDRVGRVALSFPNIGSLQKASGTRRPSSAVQKGIDRRERADFLICAIWPQVREDHPDSPVHPGRFLEGSRRAGGQYHMHAAAPHLCHFSGPEGGAGARRASGQVGGLPDPPGERQGTAASDEPFPRAQTQTAFSRARVCFRALPPGFCTAPRGCC